MGAVGLYSILAGYYLRHFERPAGSRRVEPRIADVFQVLTYRERYEDLLKRTGCDALTGALDRGYLKSHGRQVVMEAAAAGRAVSLILIDIDHFKSFNDRFGHAAGDTALKRICHDITSAVRISDLTFRFGGEEFIVIADGLTGEQALAIGERIRRKSPPASTRPRRGSPPALASPPCRRTPSTMTACSRSPINGSIKPRRRGVIA